MFAGDLLAQTCSHLLSAPLDLEFPFTVFTVPAPPWGKHLSLGSLALTAGFGTRVLCATSSHFASAEKEFRFPLGYGNQRPFSATWTVTGSGACILKHSPSRRKISSALRQRLRCHHWPYCRPGHGLRSQGFHEHGRLHGSCSLRYHCTEAFRISGGRLRIMMPSLPGIWGASGRKFSWIFWKNKISGFLPFIKTAVS